RRPSVERITQQDSGSARRAQRNEVAHGRQDRRRSGALAAQAGVKPTAAFERLAIMISEPIEHSSGTQDESLNRPLTARSYERRGSIGEKRGRTRRKK